MKRLKYLLAAALAAFFVSAPIAACGTKEEKRENQDEQAYIPGEGGLLSPGQQGENDENGAGGESPGPDNGNASGQTVEKPTEQKPAEQKPAEQKPAEQKPAEQKPAEQKPAEQKPAEQKPAEQKPAEPEKPKTVSYIKVTAAGVNIRSGAGVGYSVRGSAEKSTLYCLSGRSGGWYKTDYRNKTGYISSEYCTVTTLETSGDARIEAVILEGTKLLGTPYVYGATRFHDGNGNLLKGFTADEFDCSSLMQYIFYKGADKLLQVNTRTQVYQGKKVTAAQLKRGDLMFFTNADRRFNSGVERVGHVGLYLGGNYILHTASDYAKIEQISERRWDYFIEGRRIIG